MNGGVDWKEPLGRWWWSDSLQCICIGPKEFHTGRWSKDDKATAKYLKRLNKEIVDA